MQKEILALIEIGNSYMGNKQSNNAQYTFAQALGQYALSLPGRPLTVESPPIEGLSPHTRLRLDASEHAPSFQRLLQERHGGNEASSHIGTFSIPRTRCWVVSLHDRTELCPFDDSPDDSERLNVLIPTRRSRAFLVSHTGTTAEVYRLSSTQAKELAYLVAHLAWSEVAQLLQIYLVHQIFDDSGHPAVMNAARGFEMALSLSPRYSWALARLANLYRTIANGWHCLADTTYVSETRVRQYMIALCLFDRAIQHAEVGNRFWPCSHFGATVVNVRGFVGRDPTVSEAFEHVLTRYDFGFGSQASAEQQYVKLFDLAISRLTQAQSERGNYYPWAQAYYGFAVMLRSIADSTQARLSGQAGLLTTTSLLESAWLDPTLFLRGFEPGELYVSAYFQFGLYLYWQDNTPEAWKLVVMGLGRCFNFNFIPGLEVVAGLQILTVIWFKTLPKSSRGEPVVNETAPGANRTALEIGGVSVPDAPSPIPNELMTFMEQTVWGPITISLEPFLRPTTVLNTIILMGFQCTISILHQYIKIVSFMRNDEMIGNDEATAMIVHLRRLISRILEKIAGHDHGRAPEEVNASTDGANEDATTSRVTEESFSFMDFYDSIYTVLNMGCSKYDDVLTMTHQLVHKRGTAVSSTPASHDPRS